MAARVVLGWREWLALPALGIVAIRAKVDTGARSSALHVDAHWRLVVRGAPWVGFRLHLDRHAPDVIEAFAPVSDERDVVDSGGHRSRRVFLRTSLALAGQERDIELNLCDRRGMLFPMLLGRSALDGWCTVDPARSFLHGKPARRVALRRGPAVPSDAARYQAGHAAR